MAAYHVLKPCGTAIDSLALADRCLHEHAAGIVELLNEQPPAIAADMLQRFTPEKACEVLDQAGLECRAEIMQALPQNRAVVLLSGMSTDRVADVFRSMRDPARARLLAALDPARKAALDALLAYPDDTAGSIMTAEFICVPATLTIAQVLEHVRTVAGQREAIYSVFVVDPVEGSLIQAVPLCRLIAGDQRENVLTAAPARQPITISDLASRAEAARLISKYDLLAVAVVDAGKRLIGIVTVDDVIDAMVQRQTKQVQRYGGMEALDKPYMAIGFWLMIRKRAGWLSVLFLSEMLTASAMQSFAGELEKAIVLTLFIPLIMSSGGNSGSQSTSLIIRALAVHQIRLGDWWRVALRELPTGLTLGAILGLIGFARIVLWQTLGLYDYGAHWTLVALTVSATLIGIVTFGSMSGSMLPFILQRLGFDPATASAPFVATLVDVTGLIIYFSVALVILRGTLL